MNILTFILAMVLGAAAPIALLVAQRRNQNNALSQQEERSKLLLDAAQDKADTMAREAELRRKSDQLRIEEEIQKKYTQQKEQLNEQNRKLEKREELLDRKFEQLDQRERDQDRRRTQLDKEEQRIQDQKELYSQRVAEADHRLEEIAGLTESQAKAQLIEGIADDARRESARLLKQLEQESRESATREAQEVIATAIQRFSGEFVAEHTVSVVTIPSDDMKGRIIGREGRNIRALEAATGCDLIIDDTPEAVVISGFDPVRRQVAKRTLEELVTDGRIHPARIEGVVKKARKAINQEIMEAGERAVFDLGLHGIHNEIVKLLGTLKFRTSYTQNVLSHSIEVGFMAGIMADELGLNSTIAKRCGLLHDIGKAVDHETQGSHAVIGGQLARKYKEHDTVVNAIWSHHFDIEPASVYGPLTNAADALSAARPGARRENVQNYIKRLEDLENIANDFKGVEKSYAIQAGRELRVIVGYDRVNDEGALLIAKDIAHRVEDELTYPGQIKVTVIREMRATEVAR
ncbi:MAG: ribonuclease Y [Magnetococcales bacterium]|nr:ribonuclease Y [Magnetococcales bacterium]